jgi:hypothetical protein
MLKGVAVIVYIIIIVIGVTQKTIFLGKYE